MAFEVIQQKVGPLPLWAWGGIGVGILLLVNYRTSKTATDSGSGSATGDTGTGTVPDSQIPQFINQTYTTVQPPAVSPPNVTVPVTVNNPPPVVNPPPPPVVTPPAPKPKPPPAPKPAPKPAPAQNSHAAAKAPTKPVVHYTVQSGDSLSKIAAKYHTTWQAIWAKNGGGTGDRTKPMGLNKDPNVIYKGQVLVIP